MKIVTSWMLEGIERGKQEGELALVLRQLRRRVGVLTPQLEQRVSQLSLDQIEELGEALLDFSSQAQLETWLQSQVI